MHKLDRLSNISRILQILEITNYPIKVLLEQNIILFSNKELFQVIKYLETGELLPINQFLDDKIQEYIDLINELKTEKAKLRLKNIKEKEESEIKLEKEELSKIDFNY